MAALVAHIIHREHSTFAECSLNAQRILLDVGNSIERRNREGGAYGLIARPVNFVVGIGRSYVGGREGKWKLLRKNRLSDSVHIRSGHHCLSRSFIIITIRSVADFFESRLVLEVGVEDA